MSHDDPRRPNVDSGPIGCRDCGEELDARAGACPRCGSRNRTVDITDSICLEVADIGTGSGAISLTLACERPEWRVSTVDLSSDAIAIAKRNADSLGVAGRVRFLQGDLVNPILEAGEKLDILVSNPPYIPSEDVEELDSEVKDFEPRLALDGGADGLVCYRRLCEALPQLLKPTALVAFEVGIHQSRDVEQLMKRSGVIDETMIVPDLAGIERVVVGIRK